MPMAWGFESPPAQDLKKAVSLEAAFFIYLPVGNFKGHKVSKSNKCCCPDEKQLPHGKTPCQAYFAIV